jgi:hypothetical protein
MIARQKKKKKPSHKQDNIMDISLSDSGVMDGKSEERGSSNFSKKHQHQCNDTRDSKDEKATARNYMQAFGAIDWKVTVQDLGAKYPKMNGLFE